MSWRKRGASVRDSAVVDATAGRAGAAAGRRGSAKSVIAPGLEGVGARRAEATPRPPTVWERAPPGRTRVGEARARDLFSRVLADYGDDSVAQLAGVHLACEQVSQVLAKAIEWGRLAGYLEQSTRYIPYTDRRDGHYRWFRDPELLADAQLGPVYEQAMDGLFDTYCALLDPLREHLDRTVPPQDDPAARRRALRALALDLLRGLLPAGTVSNVGVFASPQAYEALVIRLPPHPLPQAPPSATLAP